MWIYEHKNWPNFNWDTEKFASKFADIRYQQGLLLGKMADYVTEKASAGMIGVNIGVPVPREPFSFGGWNESKFGTGDITGKSSIEFWTKQKKTTTKWNPESKVNWMS